MFRDLPGRKRQETFINFETYLFFLDRALQMDPASWANDHPTIADDSNYDDHPELSGYQTLPEQDVKDDSEVESPSPESDKKNRMSLQSASGKLASMDSGDNDKKDGASEQGAKNDTTGSGSSVVVEGMKPNALSILQGIWKRGGKSQPMECRRLFTTINRTNETLVTPFHIFWIRPLAYSSRIGL